MKSIILISTIDTHTSGAPTRVVTGGLPPILGQTLAEKTEYFKEHFDNVRRFLLCEPRGHRDMSGAIVVDSQQPGVDLGLIFLTHSGYQSMCVTSTMGAVTAAFEAGMLPLARGQQNLSIETAAGIIQASLQVQTGNISSISLQTSPAFTLIRDVEVADGMEKPLRLDIAYSGAFFALIDACQTGLSVSHANFKPLYTLGLDVLEQCNQKIQVAHPLLPDARSIEMCMIYEYLDTTHYRDLVIGRTGSVDRSPCGAGTGALLSLLLTKDKIVTRQTMTNESTIGTKFNAKILSTCSVGQYPGTVPEISARAYVTGLHQFILDADDPFPKGFIA